MGRIEKLLATVASGEADAAIRFEDLCNLMRRLGFNERIRGSHHVFSRAGVEDRVNLQRDGSHAKSYQVRQLRIVIQKYRLRLPT